MLLKHINNSLSVFQKILSLRYVSLWEFFIKTLKSIKINSFFHRKFLPPKFGRKEFFVFQGENEFRKNGGFLWFGEGGTGGILVYL